MIQDDRDGPLISMDVRDFIMTVGSRSPSPGGGSVSAFAASLVSKFSFLSDTGTDDVMINVVPHISSIAI